MGEIVDINKDSKTVEGVMTAEQFDKRYPQGLNKHIVNFERALFEIVTGNEIDKIIHCCGDSDEASWLCDFKKQFREVFTSWESVPIWMVLPIINSVELMKDIIAVMTRYETEAYHGTDLFGE